MSDPALRLDAEILARTLPATLLDARRLSAAAAGSHGRRRAGQGEAFWQFRDHRPEDGVRAVDWRRSARGDRLYVREREREAAQSLLFWIDPSPGMNWRSSDAFPTKTRRALTICLAAALVVGRAGERVGALGAPLRGAGPGGFERLAEDLSRLAIPEFGTPPRRSALILASDGYADVSVWDRRFASASAAGAKGALLLVADPAEEEFPFEGRTLFSAPGGGETEVLLGRAETVRADYARRLAAHRAALRERAEAHGLSVILHRTDRSAATALGQIVDAVGETP